MGTPRLTGEETDVLDAFRRDCCVQRKKIDPGEEYWERGHGD